MLKFKIVLSNFFLIISKKLIFNTDFHIYELITLTLKNTNKNTFQNLIHP